MQPHVLSARTECDINTAFETVVQRNVGGLLIEGDPFFGDTRALKHLVVLTARHAIPTIFQGSDFPDVGGLMSPSSDATRRPLVALS